MLTVFRKFFSKKVDDFDLLLRAAGILLPVLKQGKRVTFHLQGENVAMIVQEPEEVTRSTISEKELK